MNLFDYANEPRCERLRQRGCFEAVGLVRGVPYWRLPDGRIVEESEAFAWLEREEVDPCAPNIG